MTVPKQMNFHPFWYPDPSLSDQLVSQKSCLVWSGHQDALVSHYIHGLMGRLIRHIYLYISDLMILYIIYITWYRFFMRNGRTSGSYLKIYILIYHSTYICPNLFGWKENLIFKETIICKLQIWDFQVILTDFECSKNNVSIAGKWKAKQVLEFSS